MPLSMWGLVFTVVSFGVADVNIDNIDRAENEQAAWVDI